MTVEELLLERYGLSLPQPNKPAGLYTPVIQTGNLVYVSGQTPTKDGKLLYKGKLGRDISVEQGQQSAMLSAVNCLALLKDYLGDLDRVIKFVQLIGYVRSADEFGDQPAVMNGASKLLLDLFGERGAHTRLALGTSELPNGAATEVTFVVEVR